MKHVHDLKKMTEDGLKKLEIQMILGEIPEEVYELRKNQYEKVLEDLRTIVESVKIMCPSN
jgi:hypothetical protein